MPRGAQPLATKARNSSVVGRLRLGEVCCSSLITRPWCHEGQSLPNPVSTVRGTPVGTGRPEQVAYGLGVASTDRTARPTTAYRSLPSLRAGTRRAMRPSGPPTDEIPIWTTPDGVDSVTAQAVIDLAMRAGVAMIATGAAAADVTATVLTLTKAYGLSSVHVDVTYTSVTVSYHRGPTADPITVMRIVRFRVQDYTRLERLRGLIVDLSQDPVSVDEARVRFDSVITAPHPYRRWLVTVAGGALAAAAAGLVGAGPFIILISFLTATLVGRVLAWLTGAGVAAFFAQCVGAAIPTGSRDPRRRGPVGRPHLRRRRVAVARRGLRHRAAPGRALGRRRRGGRPGGLLRHGRGPRLRGHRALARHRRRHLDRPLARQAARLPDRDHLADAAQRQRGRAGRLRRHHLRRLRGALLLERHRGRRRGCRGRFRLGRARPRPSGPSSSEP